MVFLPKKAPLICTSGVTYGAKRSLDGNFSVTSLPRSGLVLQEDKKAYITPLSGF